MFKELARKRTTSVAVIADRTAYDVRYTGKLSKPVLVPI